MFVLQHQEWGVYGERYMVSVHVRAASIRATIYTPLRPQCTKLQQN